MILARIVDQTEGHVAYVQAVGMPGTPQYLSISVGTDKPDWKLACDRINERYDTIELYLDNVLRITLPDRDTPTEFSEYINKLLNKDLRLEYSQDGINKAQETKAILRIKANEEGVPSEDLKADLESLSHD